jgi:hypothetical protein
MGWFDFLRRPDSARDRVAIEIDLEAGVLEQCPVCRAVTDKGRDTRLAAASRIAAERFDAKDPRVAVFQGDRADLARRLRSVRDRFPWECHCQQGG